MEGGSAGDGERTPDSGIAGDGSVAGEGAGSVDDKRAISGNVADVRNSHSRRAIAAANGQGVCGSGGSREGGDGGYAGNADITGEGRVSGNMQDGGS